MVETLRSPEDGGYGVGKRSLPRRGAGFASDGRLFPGLDFSRQRGEVGMTASREGSDDDALA